MATQINNYHQVDLEEAIMQINARDFDEEFHITENAEETTLLLIQECNGKTIHHIEAEIHHQIDPSYQ